jgi:Xaa-Pro aminopeptidase
MTRTFFVGAPRPALVEMHEIVRAAQSAGTNAVRAGIEAAEVDRVCRAVFDSHGMGEWFVHGTGHGVGLEIHEAPLLAAGVADQLMPDEVVTVEPGLYREGLGGVRIEDLVVVTREGARNLTDAPKDP